MPYDMIDCTILLKGGLMELVDLHVHTSFSDGTLSPAQVVNLAFQKQLKAVAITDHDTVDGIEEACRTAEDLDLEVIAGTELSCMYHQKEIHMLGLFLDCNTPGFREALSYQRKSRNRRNMEMMRRLAEDGMSLSTEDLTGGNPDTVITRAHFARALVEKGYVKTTDQAFRRYLDHGKKYCPPKEGFTPEEAIRLILAAGGFPAIAHPMLYKMSYKEIEQMIVEFKSFGLKGVEVYYSSHCQYESRLLREICLRHSLLPTGGSDFHGLNKPDIDLGSGRGGLKVPWLLLQDIKKYREGNQSL